MDSKRILALDQGTTSCRCIVFDINWNVRGVVQKTFRQIYPQPSWVEHDAMEIWNLQRDCLVEAINAYTLTPKDVVAIGITNQRETCLLWEKKTGQPISNALVWQDKRTAEECGVLNVRYGKEIVQKTGLPLDPYFSATKLKWLLDKYDKDRKLSSNGDLLFGTIDSWLIYKLTEGKMHSTDHSNASRTLLYNINTGKWDDDLLNIFSVPPAILPQVMDSNACFGYFKYNGVEIPIHGVLGDQQAALFGQNCVTEGMAKNTYGTGCFMLMNTGKEKTSNSNGLLSTIAWSIDGELTYAMEGSVFVGGSAIKWLMEGIGLVKNEKQLEEMALQAKNNAVVFVPAFSGLGSPYWDSYARGSIFGMTLDTGKNEIIRAVLQGIAFQSYQVLKAMEKASGISLAKLKVDGGVSINNYLMQFQSDILGKEILRPKMLETTALGAAKMAAYGMGLYDYNSAGITVEDDVCFKPKGNVNEMLDLINNWDRAVKRSEGWLKK